jgi:hypothetical protein
VQRKLALPILTEPLSSLALAPALGFRLRGCELGHASAAVVNCPSDGVLQGGDCSPQREADRNEDAAEGSDDVNKTSLSSSPSTVDRDMFASMACSCPMHPHPKRH